MIHINSADSQREKQSLTFTPCSFGFIRGAGALYVDKTDAIVYTIVNRRRYHEFLHGTRFEDGIKGDV